MPECHYAAKDQPLVIFGASRRDHSSRRRKGGGMTRKELSEAIVDVLEGDADA